MQTTIEKVFYKRKIGNMVLSTVELSDGRWASIYKEQGVPQHFSTFVCYYEVLGHAVAGHLILLEHYNANHNQ
jgi:hypothetical protein